MKINYTLLATCALLAMLPLSAEIDASKEIRIQLPTECSLAPLYFKRLTSDDASFNAAYLADLSHVLEFDLHYNGKTRVLPVNGEKERVLSAKDPKAAFALQTWKDLGVAYVIKGSVAANTLHLLVFTTQTGSLKHFEEIPLSGTLSEDRRQMHKVADAVHRALFDTDGIASQRILYTMESLQNTGGKSSWVSEVWESDYDGYNARQITKESSTCSTPVALSANPKNPSDRFLYVSYKFGQPKICIASTTEGIGKRLIKLQGNQLLPAISRQRDKIAFICDVDGRTDLFIQNFSPDSAHIEKPVQLYAFPRSTQASPTFSPDGSRLAFVSDKDGRLRIYVIPTQTGGKRAEPVMITKQNPESSCPAWSPDGTKLAYSAKTDGVRQIWIYDFATKEERQLTSGSVHKENPAWAHDSAHIIFNTTEHTSSDLYLVNLNQPEAVKVSRGSGKKYYPTWVSH